MVFIFEKRRRLIKKVLKETKWGKVDTSVVRNHTVSFTRGRGVEMKEHRR